MKLYKIELYKIPHLSFAIFSLVNLRYFILKKMLRKFFISTKRFGDTRRIISNLMKKSNLVFLVSFFFNFCHFLLGRKKIF